MWHAPKYVYTLWIHRILSSHSFRKDLAVIAQYNAVLTFKGLDKLAKRLVWYANCFAGRKVGFVAVGLQLCRYLGNTLSPPRDLYVVPTEAEVFVFGTVHDFYTWQCS